MAPWASYYKRLKEGLELIKEAQKGGIKGVAGKLKEMLGENIAGILQDSGALASNLAGIVRMADTATFGKTGKFLPMLASALEAAGNGANNLAGIGKFISGKQDPPTPPPEPEKKGWFSWGKKNKKEETKKQENKQQKTGWFGKSNDKKKK